MNNETIRKSGRGHSPFAAALFSTMTNVVVQLMRVAAVVISIVLIVLPVVVLSGALIGWALTLSIVAIGFLLLEARLEASAQLAGRQRRSPGTPVLVLADPEFWLLATTAGAIALWVATVVQAFLV